ncbi:hypothetical protein HIV01_015380 [Lysobacter arenosi]|uniref:Secreted protein n=1 Tax=Lysobacter arenosi TaxID=2795387 RepID=A0ABX7R902_9GAMM|nr:hypothetical protein [Lysobacter arenosi]QSX74544.1 hypothetical protein HIV01_015380 [Lysobacter arenosi]
MSLQIALVFALAAGITAEPSLCSGVESKIEPDMRILESDISHEKAIAAADQLRGMIESDELGGEFHFAALNQLKIIQGHVLLTQAHSDRRELGPSSAEAGDSTRALCGWLGKEGFWYD